MREYIGIGLLVLAVLGSFFITLHPLALMLWEEVVHEKEITHLVNSSNLALKDGYFCLEAKCLGSFIISDNHEIKFFITRGIAEKTIKESQQINDNWSLAQDLCNEIKIKGNKQVCQLGVKVVRYNSNDSN